MPTVEKEELKKVKPKVDKGIDCNLSAKYLLDKIIGEEDPNFEKAVDKIVANIKI